MRVCSRELLVGFLLGLALVTNGCVAAAMAPAGTAEATSIVGATATINESEAASGTAALSESVAVSDGQGVSESIVLASETPSATMDISATETISLPVEGVSTASITATEEATESAGMSETAGVTASVESSTTEGNASSEAAPADPALVAAGLQAYHNLYCGVCHTLDAADTHGTFGPPHNGIGTIAATRLTDGSYHGAATSAADYIRESIIDPQAFSVPGFATTSHRMPNYSYLDSATIDALVAFLLQQK